MYKSQNKLVDNWSILGRYSLVINWYCSINDRSYGRVRLFILVGGEPENLNSSLHVAATLFCAEFIYCSITCFLTILILRGKTTTWFESFSSSCTATIICIATFKEPYESYHELISKSHIKVEESWQISLSP